MPDIDSCLDHNAKIRGNGPCILDGGDRAESFDDYLLMLSHRFGEVFLELFFEFFLPGSLDFVRVALRGEEERIHLRNLLVLLVFRVEGCRRPICI